MPITMTSLTSGADDTNQETYVTASISPPANELILVAVQGGSTVDPVVSSITGNDLTYTEVATVVIDGNRRITLFRAMGAAPSAGAVTIVIPAVGVYCHWSIASFAGVNTGGTHGSAAIVQSATNTADAATSLTVTLAAFAGAGNATYGCLGRSTGAEDPITVGTGFTEIHEVATATNLGSTQSQWRNDNDTSVDWSWSSGSEPAGIAVEIGAAASAGSGRTKHFYSRYRYLYRVSNRSSRLIERLRSDHV